MTKGELGDQLDHKDHPNTYSTAHKGLCMEGVLVVRANVELDDVTNECRSEGGMQKKSELRLEWTCGEQFQVSNSEVE